MADETAVDTTWSEDWFSNIGGNQAVIDSLNLVGADTSNVGAIDSLNAIKELRPDFGLIDNPFEIAMTGGGQEVIEEEGLEMPEISQETVDKLIPAIAIGAGELITRAGDFTLPPGVKAKARTLGVKGTAFTLAVRANDFGKDFARNILGMEKGSYGEATVGGVATYKTFKAVPEIVKNIGSNVKVGMATEVIDDVVTQASKGAFNKVMEMGADIGASKKNTVMVANNAGNKAAEEMIKQTSEVMKERLGKTATEGWDEVTKRLMNPSVSARVGRYLGSVAPKLAAKLAMSSTAIMIPEGVSTALGVAGMAWTAYDIFNLSKQMPELRALIFEGTPEESVEDAVMNELTAEESLFHSDEQRAIQ
jgi:hypothetical protein